MRAHRTGKLYAGRVSALVEVVTVIDAAPGVIFALELDVDVHSASLAGSRETAQTSSGRRRLALGDEVTFVARHFGVRWTMKTRISAYEFPRLFVDEQVRGPFRTLRHEHLFEDLGGAGTRMTDRMTINAPLGPVTEAVLAPYLRRLLIRRAAHIKRSAKNG